MQTSLIERSQPAPRLRLATIADAFVLWQWNAADDVRSISLNTSPIPLGDHCDWFADQLSSPDSAIYVAEVGGTKAGSVRIRQQRGQRATISIVVAPHLRGLGLGTKMVRRACTLFGAARVNTEIEAWILASNTSSIRCFSSAGFALERQTRRSGKLWKLYIWPATPKENRR